MPPLSLFHCTGARSLRPLWALHEINARLASPIPYSLTSLPFPPRFHDKTFLKINPIGTVPFLSHKTPTGTATLTESCAMTTYLAAHYLPDLLVAPSSPSFADFLNWNAHADATLTFPQTLVLRYTKFEKERGLQAVGEDYGKWFISRLRLLDANLEDGREFLCDGKFTVADVNVGYALILGEQLELSKRYKPQTKEYLQRLKGRGAYKSALEEEKESDEAHGVTNVAF